MTFSDIFKKSFLEGWQGAEIGAAATISVTFITFFLALYIFFVYRVITRKTFYSKNFNISLVGVAVITAAIILTVQSSIVISLGMVGALSIVRFRTAVKDPMDLMFLFWAISVGIICGAGLAEFAVILSLVLTFGVLFLDRIPVARAPMILVINTTDLDSESDILGVVNHYSDYANVKSRNRTADTLDLTIELRTNQGENLIRDVMSLNGMLSASLLSHDGEVTF